MFTYSPLVCLLLVAAVGSSESLPVRPSSVTYLSNKYASLKQFNRRVSHSVNGLLSKSKLVRKIESTTSTTTTAPATELPFSRFTTEEIATSDSDTTTHVTTTKPPSVNCTDLGILASLLRMRLVGVQFSGPFDGSEMLLTADVFPHPPKIISLDPVSKLPRPPTPSSQPTPPKPPPNFNVATQFLKRYGLPGALIDGLTPQLANTERIKLSKDNGAHALSGKHIHLTDLFKKTISIPSSNADTSKPKAKAPIPSPSPRSIKKDPNAADLWIQLLKSNPTVKVGQFNGLVYHIAAVTQRMKQLRIQQRQWLDKSFLDDANICPPTTSLLSVPTSSASWGPLAVTSEIGRSLSRALQLVQNNQN